MTPKRVEEIGLKSWIRDLLLQRAGWKPSRDLDENDCREQWKSNSLGKLQVGQMILVHLDSWGDYSDLIRRTDTIVLSIIEVEFQFLHLDILKHPDLLIWLRKTFVVQVGQRRVSVLHIHWRREYQLRKEDRWTMMNRKVCRTCEQMICSRICILRDFLSLGIWQLRIEVGGLEGLLSAEATYGKGCKEHTHDVSILGTDWTITLYDLSWETLERAGKRDCISDSTTMTIPWVAGHCCNWR